ncbi:MAG: RNA 2',3'-cyclic phosphodiesterase [Candidatus Micrarchaeaceae archaeon]|jgi:RNA 2',3'-cyclic 3'-phosphodiesterase
MEKTESNTTRAFICIEIPEEIKSNLSKLEKDFPKGNARFVSRENVHITLFFLGNITNEKIEKVKEILARINQSAFYCGVEGLSSFSMDRPHVVFADISEGRDKITDIYNSIYDDIKDLGIKTDDRKYTPHITIARTAHTKDDEKVIYAIEKNSEIKFGRFLCNSIKLKKSTLVPKGAIHSDLYEIKLK